MRIKEYQIIEDSVRSKMEERVNFQIGMGWVPLGGVSQTQVGHVYYFTQAMVKYEEERYSEKGGGVNSWENPNSLEEK